MVEQNENNMKYGQFSWYKPKTVLQQGLKSFSYHYRVCFSTIIYIHAWLYCFPVLKSDMDTSHKNKLLFLALSKTKSISENTRNSLMILAYLCESFSLIVLYLHVQYLIQVCKSQSFPDIWRKCKNHNVRALKINEGQGLQEAAQFLAHFMTKYECTLLTAVKS